MIEAANVAYIILLRMKEHPVYSCVLLMIDKEGNTVHTTHYKHYAGEEEAAEDTARALCAGYGLKSYTTIE